jgi:hypothetical protein
MIALHIFCSLKQGEASGLKEALTYIAYDLIIKPTITLSVKYCYQRYFIYSGFLMYDQLLHGICILLLLEILSSCISIFRLSHLLYV